MIAFGKYRHAPKAYRCRHVHGAGVVPKEKEAAFESGGGRSQAQGACCVVAAAPGANEVVADFAVFGSAKDDGPEVVLGDELLDDALETFEGPAFGRHFGAGRDGDPGAGAAGGKGFSPGFDGGFF